MIYKYNKLVRDKIPENIEAKGKKCSYYVLEEDKYKKELDKKLLEEANEFIVDHSIEEMADLIEVVEAIQKTHHLEKEEIEKVRLDKKSKKGGFDEKLYLVEVEEKENNELEDQNKASRQQALWENLQDTNTLREVQEYIKEINTVRGFEEQFVQDTMLLLTEEIGELAKAIRKTVTNMCTDVNKQSSYDTIESEVADCFYVLASVCNKLNIDIFNSLKEKERENLYRVWKRREEK